ncbi:MAG: hypothetical protein J7K26_03765 [Candidatus Aenigmarchaeota archaeon]|nr:hypothetical protein [Candidatus Aenigmarchaeota archaeon]
MVLAFNKEEREAYDLIRKTSWNDVLDHINFLKRDNITEYVRNHGQEIYFLESREDIVNKTYEMVKNSQERVIIKSGDFDHVTDKNADITGDMWLETYRECVNRLGKENVTIIMHIEGWTEKTARAILETGVNLKHNISDLHAGIVDDYMFNFYKTRVDEKYVKVVGTPQRQPDKMVYRGYVTNFKPFVAEMKKTIQEIIKEAEDAEVTLKRIEKLKQEGNNGN